MKIDYYQVLGVSKTASIEDIKKSHREAVKKYHPDRNKSDADAATRFQEVTEAYDVLSDPQKRIAYDRSYASVNDGRKYSSNSGFNNNFWDIFNNKNYKPPHVINVPKVFLEIELSFEEAYFGVKKEIEYNTLGICDQCNGRGATKFKSCNFCDGQGATKFTQGPFVIQQTCNYCNGSGSLPLEDCTKCNGQKFVPLGKVKETISIPPGVLDNTQLAKDISDTHQVLNITIKVKEHEFYNIKDLDIVYSLPLKYFELCNGIKTKVRSVEGDLIDVEVPPQSQPASTIRIWGKGMRDPFDAGVKGDFVVVLKLSYPDNIDNKYKSELDNFAKTESSYSFEEREKHNDFTLGKYKN